MIQSQSVIVGIFVFSYVFQLWRGGGFKDNQGFYQEQRLDLRDFPTVGSLGKMRNKTRLFFVNSLL
ncbi:hypothetical protein [Spartinivicinus ruber]|uniref:hypothetical protein n=1 Tax=Spartinivicinus ruber TaxID=2683272 RepID=UPI0013D23FF4|nr:hypothetical protein [Spartinivicinus ruber]